MRSAYLKLFLVPAMAVAAALVSQSASAETINVPFSFTAIGQNFPAGNYSVIRDLGSSFVSLRLDKSDRRVTCLLGPGAPDPRDTRVVLRFAQSGDQHFLDSIQFGSKITLSLTKLDRHHRELGARPVSGQ